MLTPTEEEERLLELFTPENWEKECKRRGIDRVALASAKLTPSGVVGELVINGKHGLKELRSKHQIVRAMLDVLDTDLSDFSPSGRASKILFAVRTRYVTDQLDMLWHPDIKTLGRDTVTGEEVDVPPHERTLVGGASGSGKSWSTRSLMARAVVQPNEELGAFIDGKGEEATVWKGICYCAVSHDEIIAVIEDEYERMEKRRILMAQHGLSEWKFELGPRRLIVIDEGYSVLCAAIEEDKRRGKVSKGGEDGDFGPSEGSDKPVLQKLTEISSQGRSREIILMWMTQNPLRSGDDRGITSGIRTNFDYGFCLRVNTQENTNTVLNRGSGVEPHSLPRGKKFRGHGYLNTHGSNLIRTWTVTNEMVALLAHPNHGRGKYPRDVALRTLRTQPESLWTPSLLTSHTGCGEDQAACFLRSFVSEGLMKPHGEAFRLTA